ncbi:MAG: flagellar brake protein, partial [bacterium]
VQSLYLPITDNQDINLNFMRVSARFQTQSSVTRRMDRISTPRIVIPRPDKMQRVQMREFVRVPCSIPVTIRTMEDGGYRELEAQAVDISAGGMKCELDEEISEESEVMLTFELPLTDEYIDDVFGDILRVLEDTVEDCYVVALQFSGLTEDNQERIIRYTYRRQIEMKQEGQWVSQ